MNVYYSPEAFGLKVVGEAEASRGWNFDTFIVWQRADGAYLWAYDSGCSCPVPFDGFNLSNLPAGSARDALTDLRAWVEASDLDDRRAAARPLVEKLEAAA